MLYWKTLDTRDWELKLIKKLFTGVINQVRSGAIFSYAYIQSNLLLAVALWATRKNTGTFASTKNWPERSIHILYSQWLYRTAAEVHFIHDSRPECLDKIVGLYWKSWLTNPAQYWCGTEVLDDGCISLTPTSSPYLWLPYYYPPFFLAHSLFEAVTKEKNWESYHSFCITSPSVSYKIMFIHFALRGEGVKGRWLNSNLTSIII